MRINRTLLHRLFAALFNIVLTGLGLVLLGRWRLAALTQALLTAVIVATCWSRWIFEPAVIASLLAYTGIIYLLSTLACLLPPKPTKGMAGIIAGSFAFAIVCLVGFAVGFTQKQHWLGSHIYFVPSMSMYPTLKPGEFILVDTWAYDKRTPKRGEIVVFKHREDLTQWLVKRIAKWPKGKLRNEGLLYVTGDNQVASRDSRYFGGVEEQHIIGQAKLVFTGISKQVEPVEKSYLRALR